MGAVKSKISAEEQQHHEVNSRSRLVKVSSKSHLPMEVQIAHYTPSTFPLMPQLKPDFLPLCRRSWQLIVAQNEVHEEYGTHVAGITAFYNEFYERLGKVDSKGIYEEILMKHAVGTNRIAAKGAILVRIVDFLLRFDGDTPETKKKLKILGISHKHKAIRPWQYSVFLELFLLTMGSRLKKFATPSIMEAWVNLLAFSLKAMLPHAIDGIVVESEAHVNFVLNEEGLCAEDELALGRMSEAALQTYSTTHLKEASSRQLETANIH
eukprot:scaffold725_cov162-Ochromonas_danica.AAC.10